MARPAIASLGVDAIWISPLFKSPTQDCGYGISDYIDVDPLFGDLLDKVHALNLKIIVDLVINHTTDQHACFKESCRNRKVCTSCARYARCWMNIPAWP